VLFFFFGQSFNLLDIFRSCHLKFEESVLVKLLSLLDILPNLFLFLDIHFKSFDSCLLGSNLLSNRFLFLLLLLLKFLDLGIQAIHFIFVLLLNGQDSLLIIFGFQNVILVSRFGFLFFAFNIIDITSPLILE